VSKSAVVVPEVQVEEGEQSGHVAEDFNVEGGDAGRREAGLARIAEGGEAHEADLDLIVDEAEASLLVVELDAVGDVLESLGLTRPFWPSGRNHRRMIVSISKVAYCIA